MLLGRPVIDTNLSPYSPVRLIGWERAHLLPVLGYQLYLTRDSRCCRVSKISRLVKKSLPAADLTKSINLVQYSHPVILSMDMVI